jgi:uncharacterized ferritin-like protein (DUF455 family)
MAWLSDSLTTRAVTILVAPDPAEKIGLTRAAATAWRGSALRDIGDTQPPDRPARPHRPPLLPPRDMPKRRAGGSAAGHIALLHALTPSEGRTFGREELLIEGEGG